MNVKDCKLGSMKRFEKTIFLLRFERPKNKEPSKNYLKKKNSN